MKDARGAITLRRTPIYHSEGFHKGGGEAVPLGH